MLQKINRGDVYFYNFGFDYDGSIEGKNRPCVIISNDKGNNFGTTALVAPITTRSKESCKPWQVHFQNGAKSQIILCEQIKTVNINNLYNYQGKLDALTMKAVDVALAVEFDLNVTQKEIDSTEFLHRLDNALYKITNARLAKYDKKITEIIENMTSTIMSYKDECEKLCNDIVNKMSTMITVDNNIANEVADIKSMFRKNIENCNVLINSFNNDINGEDNNSDISPIVIKETKHEPSISNEINSVCKTKRLKYSIDDAKEYISDYYSMDRKQFMNKYNLRDITMLNNKLTTMKNLLNRNGINWKEIKDSVTQTEIQLETYTTINQDCSNKVFGQNKGLKYKNRVTNFDYNLDNCLTFIDEWNRNSIDEMCEKYQMNYKQMTNRKYLICKWLTKNNVEFKIKKINRRSYN